MDGRAHKRMEEGPERQTDSSLEDFRYQGEEVRLRRFYFKVGETGDEIEILFQSGRNSIF